MPRPWGSRPQCSRRAGPAWVKSDFDPLVHDDHHPAEPAGVHDRMPVLLRPDQFDAWLDGSAGKEMLVPAAEDMLNRVPVSQRVNSSRAPNDDPTLIEPITLAA